VGSVTGTKS